MDTKWIKLKLKGSPRWAIRLIRKIYVRKSNRTAWKRLNREIRDASATKATKGVLKEMSTFGEYYAETIHEMCCCSVQKVMERKAEDYTKSDPIVVCVLRNEMSRLALFMDYYRRNLGIKAFAFLDDHSTDGTREYLERQKDVSLYVSEGSYTSLRRVTWINRIIEAEGLDRWYLIVDADEFFDYQGRETKKIDQLTHFLEVHKQSRVRALMVDMFAPDKLFSEKLGNENNFVEVYNRFFSEYYYESENNIIGGGRSELFQLAAVKNDGLCVTKYPLIHVDKYDFLINAHRYYPKERNTPVAPMTVLRHYKFLPSDKQRYEERVQKGNFYKNSIEYRGYKKLESADIYAAFIKRTKEYKGYESFVAIEPLKDIKLDGDVFFKLISQNNRENW